VGAVNAEEFIASECRSVCEDHEAFYQRLGDIAVRNVAFEQEFLSHLSALQELNRREQRARDERARVILERLGNIDDRIGHVTNGGLKEAMLELVPVLLNNLGANKTETTRGKYAVIVTAISGLAAVGGALLSWLIAH